ncbi:Acyl-protein synthetase, LuxE [Pseudovibrio denitrificans]|uniref:Acyl-protein synthetase, LuxE n=1 Tax=Pseudovibrio denitrificans TaxID=258256 RepID=A0A1I7CTP9_9HYPH|nr:long-chain fatty acid--CoA ligase [Pseudovibrio denitrificans]SFU02782.1 Acyl-protein synthetase, LuxE [Pseudovibrio denitrificans]
MSIQALIDELYLEPVYGLSQQEKDQKILPIINALTLKHEECCEAYGNILKVRNDSSRIADNIADVPFLPVRLFKTNLLSSVRESEQLKVLTSSGTTGQQVSRIVLDKDTSVYQTKTVVKIMQHFLGKDRLPMLIIDHPNVVKNRQSFSARGAGILGMSNFGRSHTYILNDDDMGIDWEKLVSFLEKYSGGPVLLFGFTFMVWKYLIQALEKTGRRINIPNGILIHSGGWKKLVEEAVDNETFKSRLKAATGINKVHNFYGMVEQVGSIFVECEHGHLHAPIFSDVIIRNPLDWSEMPANEQGLVQVVSCLPLSYPGHSLLTEDLGVLLGEDDCPCGKKGRYFSVSGRLPKSEARGCSDTFQENRP